MPPTLLGRARIRRGIWARGFTIPARGDCYTSRGGDENEGQDNDRHNGRDDAAGTGHTNYHPLPQWQ